MKWYYHHQSKFFLCLLYKRKWKTQHLARTNGKIWAKWILIFSLFVYKTWNGFFLNRNYFISQYSLLILLISHSPRTLGMLRWAVFNSVDLSFLKWAWTFPIFRKISLVVQRSWPTISFLSAWRHVEGSNSSRSTAWNVRLL